MSGGPYIIKFKVIKERKYNPDYGDDRICKCGHEYHRHFDWMEDNASVGCKYCWNCRTFVEQTEEDIMNKKEKIKKKYPSRISAAGAPEYLVSDGSWVDYATVLAIYDRSDDSNASYGGEASYGLDHDGGGYDGNDGGSSDCGGGD